MKLRPTDCAGSETSHVDKKSIRSGILWCFFFVLCQQPLQAQTTWPLGDLSAFDNPGPAWKLAGDVRADISKKEALTASPGTGILVNAVDKDHTGKDLFTRMQYGDMDLELDFMMATGSNSGIYLQGRYEIQLLDSWGVQHATAADNGGIYERWDESRPNGQYGYEGHAPRQNAGKAPGLWQHLKIMFQAPRFTDGRKTENAKILRLELNGILVQENVELSGPTRGAMANNEVPMGPLRFQGDHGPVAFRRVRITSYDKPRPELINLKYTVYKGLYDADQEYKNKPPEAEGNTMILSSNINTIPNEFLIRYTGTMRVKESGEYNFNLSTSGGKGSLRIGDRTAIPLSRHQGTGKLTLPAGELPFELIYSKFLDFAKPALGLAVTGPGIREYMVSDANASAGDPVDPILIQAPVNTILRSFTDIDTFRVTHAVNVGSARQVHYTYDMDRGMIVQLWRGDFLDATPMWHSRGDGSSRPAGVVQQFGKPVPAIEKLASPDAPWKGDTTGSGYRMKGYVVDDSDRPVFRYLVYGLMVNDRSQVLSNNGGIQREISLQNPVAGANLYVRLAAAEKIDPVSDGLYLLDDKSYYLRLDDTVKSKPIIRDANGHKEMLLPIQDKITYSILF